MFLQNITKLNYYDAKIRKEIANYRQHVHILVIDDEEFVYIKRLRQINFKITKIDDYNSINDITGYNIILCDIRGVGRALSPKYEGAFVIKEIKKNRNDVKVIAFTVSQYDPETIEYLKLADDLIGKSIIFSDIVDKLDQYIYDLLSPINIWNAIKVRLVAENYSKFKSKLFEHYYVKSFLEKKQDIYMSLKKKVDTDIVNAFIDLVVFSLKVYIAVA